MEVDVRDATRLSLEFTVAKQEEDVRRSFVKDEQSGLPDFHLVSLSEIQTRFHLDDLDNGLTESQATASLKLFGPNVAKPPKKSALWYWIRVCFRGFNGILWLSAILSWVAWGLGYLRGETPSTGNLALAIALVVVVLINIGISIAQDYSSSSVMKSINSMMPQFSQVIREGEARQIPASELVPGDLLRLENGEKVPADVRILSVHGLKVDQSVLTGESEPIALRRKTTSANYLETKNMAFCGGCVVDGSGIGVVVATGNNTIMGSLAAHANKSSKKETYLYKEIRRAIIIIGTLCAITAVACFVTYVAWLRRKKAGFMSWSGIVGICIGLIVAYLPVGLPLCVAITLFIVAKRMARENVLVKELTIIETLGSVNMIASDKTGTLTQNKMSVTEIVLGNGAVYSAPAGFNKASRQSPALFNSLVDISLHCNGANVDPTKSVDLPLEERIIIGGASDIAILKFAAAFLEDGVAETRDVKPIVAQIPFNSKNKYMVTVHDLGKKKPLLMYMKGAAESMIDRCNTFLDEDGSVHDLPTHYRAKLVKLQVAMCKKGERVLGLIRKEVEETEELPIRSDVFNVDDYELPITDGFTFIGLVALMDPPRKEVPEVIEKCHHAGIKVAMVTGDHPDTAVSIAKMVGIVKGDHVNRISDFVADSLPFVDPSKTYIELNRSTAEFFRVDDEARTLPRAVVINGPELQTFDDAMWEWALGHRDLVFARTSPENKLEIVKQMQKRGYSVAVTGDGVNDSPALKQADVGVAMGGGSDVAKEAAPVILTDNNFTSLLAGVENGRLVFANMKKVFLYLLPAGTFAELLPVLFNLFLGLPLPLSTFLMIYICVITDVAPCIAIVFEKSESDVMKQKPRSPKAHLLDAWVYLQAYAFSGLIEVFCAFTMYFYYLHYYAHIPVNKLWLAYQKYDVNTSGPTIYPNPAGGFYTGKQLNNFLNTAQSCYFAAVVLSQFGNLLGSKSQRVSIWSSSPLMGPSRNLFLVASIPISLITAVFILYVPALNKVFGTAPIPWEFWFLPLYFAMGLFVLHEIRKLIARTIPLSSIVRCFKSVCGYRCNEE